MEKIATILKEDRYWEEMNQRITDHDAEKLVNDFYTINPKHRTKKRLITYIKRNDYGV